MSNILKINNLTGQHLDKAVILRYPKKFIENKEPLDKTGRIKYLSYLDKLIENNILRNDSVKSRHDVVHYNCRAAEVRALVNSLSDEHKKKFAEIVMALEPNKEMIKGVIFSGGEIRVIAESGPAMIINAIVDLLGIGYSTHNPNPTFKDFSGTSAGSFPAASMAFRALNSSIFKSTADTDFTSFHYSPETLEDWINGFMKRGYHISTGKRTDIILGKHLKEVGANLQVLVGEAKIPPKTYLFPRELKKFGVNEDDYPCKSFVRATANLPFLFYPLSDLFDTCGNCFVEDNKGKKHYLYDPGIFHKYLLPLNLLNEDIEKYKTNKIDKPGFYFVVSNVKVRNNDENGLEEDKLFTKFERWLYSYAIYLSDQIDEYLLGTPNTALNKVGAQRSHIKAFCEAKDPVTNKTAKIITGNLNVSRSDKTTILCANIPTSDFKELNFKPAIDQMHTNLVDPLFASSYGTAGKSAYKMYLNDVNKALGKATNNSDLSAYSKTKLLINRFANEAKRVAAFYY